MIKPGKSYWSYWRGRLSTVDLLLLTSLDKLLFTLKILFTLFKKQAILIRRSTVLSLPPPQLVFPDETQIKTESLISVVTEVLILLLSSTTLLYKAPFTRPISHCDLAYSEYPKNRIVVIPEVEIGNQKRAKNRTCKWPLRLIFTSDFRGRFHIRLVRFFFIHIFFHL